MTGSGSGTSRPSRRPIATANRTKARPTTQAAGHCHAGQGSTVLVVAPRSVMSGWYQTSRDVFPSSRTATPALSASRICWLESASPRPAAMISGCLPFAGIVTIAYPELPTVTPLGTGYGKQPVAPVAGTSRGETGPMRSPSATAVVAHLPVTGSGELPDSTLMG